MIDVKKIEDIPRIEDFINLQFELDLYDIDNKICCYSSMYDEDTHARLDIIVKNAECIEGSIILADLIVLEGVVFFDWIICDGMDNLISRHCYRPLVDESEKNYK